MHLFLLLLHMNKELRTCSFFVIIRRNHRFDQCHGHHLPPAGKRDLLPVAFLPDAAFPRLAWPHPHPLRPAVWSSRLPIFPPPSTCSTTFPRTCLTLAGRSSFWGSPKHCSTTSGW